jgi:tumor protein p53-inducible protein 3
MRAVTFTTPGNAEVLQLTQVDTPQPRPNELLVKVHATALNRADLSQRRGSYPPPSGHSSILGLEMAGEVVSWGNEVNGFKKGDRVFGLIDGGGYAEYCVIDQQMAMHIPNAWNYEYAAAIPEVFLTAQVCLFQLGELQKNQSSLIHAGGSGVGTAAIQMAKQTGAIVFITAGNIEKINKCLELGADVGINYKTEDFVTVINAHTKNVGVDVIVDPVGGDYFPRNLTLLKKEGRLIQLATMGGEPKEIPLRLIIMHRLQIKGNAMRSRSLEQKRQITAEFSERWLPLLISGKIKAVIDSVFPIEKVQDAHRYLESNKNFGKVILSIL